jgi:phytoene synthase
VTTTAASISGLSRETAPPSVGDTALAGIDASRLAEAYAHCAEIARTRARNFYYGLRLTPEPRRSAIYSIYAWMRAADDVADGPDSPADRHERLRVFGARTRRITGGELPNESDDLLWLALAATTRRFPIDPAIFDDMLLGLNEDLDHPGYATDAELSMYCYRVAGTAGLACVWIWGLKPGIDPAHARDLALRRGQAFQRTNILRDFAQDFDESPSRVYLPQDAFDRHGLTSDDVRHWRTPDRCEAFIREQARIARDHYTASAELQSLIDPACSPTLWAMTRIYSGLLEIIEQDPARIAGAKRIRLSGAKKAGIALSGAVMARVGRW